MIVPTPELSRDSKTLAALSAKAGLPTTGGFRESAQQGLLIGYGPSLSELRQQAASYVERIFNGAQAGELPFQGPTHFDFAINMKTAKALGITIPPSLFGGAEIIEGGLLFRSSPPFPVPCSREASAGFCAPTRPTADGFSGNLTRRATTPR